MSCLGTILKSLLVLVGSSSRNLHALRINPGPHPPCQSLAGKPSRYQFAQEHGCFQSRRFSLWHSSFSLSGFAPSNGWSKALSEVKKRYSEFTRLFASSARIFGAFASDSETSIAFSYRLTFQGGFRGLAFTCRRKKAHFESTFNYGGSTFGSLEFQI